MPSFVIDHDFTCTPQKKIDDDEARSGGDAAIVARMTTSVATGRSMEQIWRGFFEARQAITMAMLAQVERS